MTKESMICETLTVPQLDKIDVDVFANPNGAGGVSWSHKVKTPGHDNGGKIKLGKNVGYDIQFDLHVANGLSVRFDASAPFFVKDGIADPCPDTLGSTQCMVNSCKAKELMVIDWNYGAERQLRYQLNFVDDTGKRVNPYDPIIENGGGGVPPFFES